MRKNGEKIQIVSRILNTAVRVQAAPVIEI
jgi:hypothetical protein